MQVILLLKDNKCEQSETLNVSHNQQQKTTTYRYDDDKSIKKKLHNLCTYMVCLFVE